MKFTFSFKEINYGIITVVSDHGIPKDSEIIDEIINGEAFISSTTYENITLVESDDDETKGES